MDELLLVMEEEEKEDREISEKLRYVGNVKWPISNEKVDHLKMFGLNPNGRTNRLPSILFNDPTENRMVRKKKVEEGKGWKP